MKAKIGCYVRVSTTDKGQTTKSQRHAIRQWAEGAHVPTGELRYYEDHLSGKDTDRPQLAKLLRDIDRAKVDTLVVFRLDRLARNLRDGLTILSDVADKGIRVVSVSENIDFGNSTGRLIASILLAVAAFERETTVERIRAGMAAARANGKNVGRPRDNKKLNHIRELFDGGLSAIDIAKQLGTSRANVYAALAKTRQDNSKGKQ